MGFALIKIKTVFNQYKLLYTNGISKIVSIWMLKNYDVWEYWTGHPVL